MIEDPDIAEANPFPPGPAGGASVPAIITEAATKIVACELMAEDDSTLLLGENGEAGLALADKYTKYKEEIDKILGMKKRLVYFLDND